MQIGTIHQVFDHGDGVFTVDFDLIDGKNIERIEYGLSASSDDVAPVHVALKQMYSDGDLDSFIIPVPVTVIVPTADMVRAECKRRILEVYPEHQQRNDTHDLIKPAGDGLPSLLNLVENGTANAEQQARYDGIQERISAKDNLLKCCKFMKVAPPPDYGDDTRWNRTNWDNKGNYTPA